MNNMPTVFVTQETALDYTDAEQYGALEFLTSDDLHNTKNSLHNEQLMADLRFKLRRVNQDEDYVLVSGSAYINSAVFMILGALGVKRIKILRWDNRSRHYVPLHLELGHEST